MANNANMRAMYTRTGFSEEAASGIVNVHMISTLEELHILKDTKIENLWDDSQP